MKIFITLLLLTFCYGVAKAQTNDNTKIGQSFVTKVSIVVNPYDDKTGTILTKIHYLLNDGTMFFVYDVTDKGYLVSVWDFKDKDGKKKEFYNSFLNSSLNDHSTRKGDSVVINNAYYRMLKDQTALAEDTISSSGTNSITDTTLFAVRLRKLAYVDSWGNNMKFFISLKDFNDKCQSIYPSSRSFTWGFLTLPIKARVFGPFTFEEKVNFGVSFGIKWQQANPVYSAHNLLFGVSISNVRVDSTNAKHYSTALNNTSAFTFSGGYMYQFDKFQIGAFVGWDFISNNASVGWRYQGLPWIGVGLGFSLFSENQVSPQKDQTQADHN